MTNRPAILFYCQHSLGMGNLVRSFALAERLAERFRVMLLNGGRLPKGIVVPRSVQLVNLPPLGIDETHHVVSHDKRISVEGALDRRQKMIRVSFDNLRPVAVLIELFPFARKEFAAELLPLLRAAHTPETRALVVCSVRDMLVHCRANQQQHDDRAAALANEFFDLIMVHSDPSFARFEESFASRVPLAVPVEYTGFVVPRSAPATPLENRRNRILVSAGGGRVGEPLFRAAIEAHQHLDHDVEMKIVTGPFFSDEAWESLRLLTRDKDRVRLVRHVSDLCGELNKATLSISQAGYNTCLDILRSDVPALLVPFTSECKDEQRRRALRLQELGAVKVLEQPDLTPARLAAEIRELMNLKFQRPLFDLNGTEKSARLIESRTALKSTSTAL